MEELEQLRFDLAQRKTEAQMVCDSLWSQITSLWERLETNPTERNEARRKCPGIKQKDISQLEKVTFSFVQIHCNSH